MTLNERHRRLAIYKSINPIYSCSWNKCHIICFCNDTIIVQFGYIAIEKQEGVRIGHATFLVAHLVIHLNTQAENETTMSNTCHFFCLNSAMGKCSNAFFSETTNMIKAKLYINVHWMVLYKFYVFCSGMKFQMAATAGLSLTLDPMRKMFRNASSLKPLGQLKPNCLRMIIGRSSTKFLFYMSIGNPRWPPPQYIN